MVLTTAHNETGREAQSLRAGHKSAPHLLDRNRCGGFDTRPMLDCWCSINCLPTRATVVGKGSPLRYAAWTDPVMQWVSHVLLHCGHRSRDSLGFTLTGRIARSRRYRRTTRSCWSTMAGTLWKTPRWLLRSPSWLPANRSVLAKPARSKSTEPSHPPDLGLKRYPPITIGFGPSARGRRFSGPLRFSGPKSGGLLVGMVFLPVVFLIHVSIRMRLPFLACDGVVLHVVLQPGMILQVGRIVD